MVGETVTAATSTPDRIEISVPLRTEFASTLRTLAASIGADSGFSVDEIDDLRLALSEVFSILAEAADGGRAEVAFTVSPGELAVSIGTDQPDTRFELDTLALSILQSVTDGYDLRAGGISFSKRTDELGSRPPRS